MPHPWQCSRPGWTGLGATCSSGRCPCPGQGGGTRGSLRHFPTQTILWLQIRGTRWMLHTWRCPYSFREPVIRPNDLPLPVIQNVLWGIPTFCFWGCTRTEDNARTYGQLCRAACLTGTAECQKEWALWGFGGKKFSQWNKSGSSPGTVCSKGAERNESCNNSARCFPLVQLCSWKMFLSPAFPVTLAGSLFFRLCHLSQWCDRALTHGSKRWSRLPQAVQIAVC